MALEAARQIVRKDGIQALSGRKVTARIGYTIGTLYQLFDDMDHLVERMNAETLAHLFEHCRAEIDADTVSGQLKTLAFRFIEFVKTHPNEWDAVMSYRYKDGHVSSDFYVDEIQRLFGLMANATAQFYPEGAAEDQAADMALLWSSLTGIWGIAASERTVGGSMEQMIDRLVEMYVSARS